MSTFLRKTARIFASDLDLGFMTWRNVLKDFRTELSSLGMLGDAEHTWGGEALPAPEGRIGCALLEGPATTPPDFLRVG